MLEKANNWNEFFEGCKNNFELVKNKDIIIKKDKINIVKSPPPSSSEEEEKDEYLDELFEDIEDDNIELDNNIELLSNIDNTQFNNIMNNIFFNKNNGLKWEFEKNKNQDIKITNKENLCINHLCIKKKLQHNKNEPKHSCIYINDNKIIYNI